MADEPGFFDKLVGSSVDETTVRNQQISDNVAQGGRMAALGLGLGQQAGGLGVGAAGLLGTLERFGGEKGAGFKKNFASASGRAEERMTAQANGITPEELRSRRRIRTETAGITDDGTFNARKSMAEIAARIANEEGDARGLARALSALDQLQTDELEFDKLGSEATTAEAEAIEAQVENGFFKDGTAVSGVRGIKDGDAGLWTEIKGEMVFEKFGDEFSQVDPKRALGRGGSKGIGNQLKINKGQGYVTKVNNLASSANSALNKTRRVLHTLNDLFQEGGVESVIGFSGRLITSVDNLSKNINGIINAFASRGSAEDSKTGVGSDGTPRTWNGRKGLSKFAEEAGNSFSDLIQLPEGIERTSAAAQQHRAAVMDMAYMAARLAEPSNRGLSDNDIKNALARIAGDTSNPQVMMRRFLEMQVDAAQDLDFELRLAHGSLGPDVSDAEINMALVGKGYEEYKQNKDLLFSDFGITVTGDGRAVFQPGTQLGADVGPGEGPLPEQANKGTVDTSTMSNDEAAEALGL